MTTTENIVGGMDSNGYHFKDAIFLELFINGINKDNNDNENDHGQNKWSLAALTFVRTTGQVQRNANKDSDYHRNEFVRLGKRT